MAYSLVSQNALTQQAQPVKASLFHRFVAWTDQQEALHHIGWAGFSIMAMAAVFFPATMTVVLMNGAAFGNIIAAMIAFVMVVVLNLAAQPARYTIPALVVACIIDAAVIIVSLLG